MSVIKDHDNAPELNEAYIDETSTNSTFSSAQIQDWDCSSSISLFLHLYIDEQNEWLDFEYQY